MNKMSNFYTSGRAEKTDSRKQKKLQNMRKIDSISYKAEDFLKVVIILFLCYQLSEYSIQKVIDFRFIIIYK